MASLHQLSRTEENKVAIKNGLANNIKRVSNDGNKVLIAGYSPTGGGHTARTLNIIYHALKQGSLSAGDQVYFHVPPHWEGTQRPALLENLANKLVETGVQVRIAESDKPVYGYLNAKTGSSNDPEILRRIALHPLRDKERTERNSFLNRYFPQESLQQQKEIKNYTIGDEVENLPRMSASTLIENIIRVNGGNKDNIWVLSDMDPSLQKAAHKHSIPYEHRVDQQNHAILLKKTDEDSNLVLANAVLAKVLDARGANISHIALGEKNTLIEAWKTATVLGINEKSTLNDRKVIINNIIYQFAKSAENPLIDIANGCVLKGHGVNSPEDIENVIYVYAHKKTNIIAEHILNQLKMKNPDYINKLFVFCSKDSIPGYNAMHLAYLVDADGITTAGAGTSGEFAYLHREGGAKSSLLILPIENHNEQEAIAETLYLDFSDYVLRMNPGERLESGKKIDELVRRSSTNHSGTETDSGKLMKAISDAGSYVEQTHNILFSNIEMDDRMIKFWNIQRKMYNDQDMKATRHFLKLYFQLTTNFFMEDVRFPIDIFFKKCESPAIRFNNAEEINELFSNNTKIMDLISMSSKERVNQLPLFSEVKNLMTKNIFPPSADEINALNEKFGHYMTTGF